MQFKLRNILPLLLCATQVLAWNNPIYVIREAERASLGEGGLSPVGRNRATNCLITRFGLASSANIGKIISCRPDPTTGRCDAAFQTVAPLATNLGLPVDVTCTTDETKSIETCVTEVINRFVATSTKAILIVWDTEELDQVFDNFDFEDDEPDFPEQYPDLFATIRNNVFLGLSSEACSGLDGNSGAALSAATTINAAVPTPTPTVARRDIIPTASTSSIPSPAFTIGVESSSSSSSGIATASSSATSITQTESSATSITLIESSATEPSSTESQVNDLPTTLAFPTLAATEILTSPSTATPAVPAPIEIDVEVQINIGGTPRRIRKGCKVAGSNHTNSESSSTTAGIPTPTSIELPLETSASSESIFTTEATSTASASSELPTLSAASGSSVNSTATATSSHSTESASSTHNAFPFQTPSFSLRRMIRRHTKREALRL